MTHVDGVSEEPRWRELVAPYRNPHLWRSLWQLANTLVPFLVTWYVMYLSLNYSYWLTLILAPVAAGLQLRLFIIFHDCGHQAFFKSQKINDIVGSICGFFCFTPYYHWRHSHAIHHATTGNLGRRIEGEILPVTIRKYAETNGHIFTLTVREYQQSARWEKLIYRIYRNPVLFFLVTPFFLFLVLHRFASSHSAKRERYSVIGTNLALLMAALILVFLIGLGPLLLVELPIVYFAACAGVWLFYVQHQFEDSYWEESGKWNFVKAAMQGSSYYKLPKILQWFTGNIGFHHIHHLSPRIPNYYLERCHEASPWFKQTQFITLKAGMKSMLLRLWDEEQGKMVGCEVNRPKMLRNKNIYKLLISFL